MNKRGKININLIIVVVIILFTLILQTQAILSSENIIFSKPTSVGHGGASVPVSTIDLTEQGNDYSMKPGRLKFEFDGKAYAVQVRRVKQEYVWFLIMILDMNKPNDITAYTLDNSFNLSVSENKEIDLDKDGTKDIFVELNNVISTMGSVRSADFSIKKIKNEK
jgi:hypothetical protein